MEYQNPDNQNEFFVTKVQNNSLVTYVELRSTTSQIKNPANKPGDEEIETITTVIKRKMLNQQTKE